jgi:glycosyltransferase involved in cell wall biosynthesis
VNPNGLNYKLYKGERKKLEKFTVLYVGQIDEFKGIFELQTVCKELGFKLIVSTQSAPMMDRFNKHQTTENVYIRPDFYKLVDLYFSADVLVLPTKWDTYPTVILEAFACGLPVISTKVGGIPDMVYHQYLFDPSGDLKGSIKRKLLEFKNSKEPYVFGPKPVPIDVCITKLFSFYERLIKKS